MPAPGDIVLFVAVIGLVVLLSARIVMAVPGWVQRARRPETRAIRVIGVGGGGSNAVDRMVGSRIRAVSFVACNTDAQALRRSTAETKLRIGDAITRGLGSGGDPDVGRRAAEEDKDRIASAMTGADLVFVTAGLGGGTGSGAAPIVAASARQHGALTIAVVTKPFGFEGAQRRRIAETAAAELAASVDALIIVPNDRVSDVIADDATLIDAFHVVDDVLLQAVQGIIDLVTAPGLINLDFADIRSVMKDAGPALIGLGRGTGDHRALDAARQAVSSPLLEASIDGARGILFNVSGPADLRLSEVRQAADAIRERADPEANVIFGASFSESLGEDILITLIATGLEGDGLTGRPAIARPPVGTPPAETRPVVSPTVATAAVETRPAHDAPIGAPPVEDPTTPLVAAPTDDPPHITLVKRPSKRAARTAKDPSHADAVSSGVDAVPSNDDGDVSLAAIDDPAQTEPPTPEAVDLDVPSFLRRKGPPAGRP